MDTAGRVLFSCQILLFLDRKLATMSSAPSDIPAYQRPPATKSDLDYAQLASIDLSKWPLKKDELLSDIRHAVNDVGFWFVVNTGITDEEVLRQLSIGASRIGRREKASAGLS